MLSERTRSEAMLRARDAAEITYSGRVTLVQEAGVPQAADLKKKALATGLAGVLAFAVGFGGSMMWSSTETILGISLGGRSRTRWGAL